MHRQNDRCFFCGEICKRWKTAQQEDSKAKIIDIDRGRGTERMVQCRLILWPMATVEHLNGLSDNEALVMACYRCNRERGRPG